MKRKFISIRVGPSRVGQVPLRPGPHHDGISLSPYTDLQLAIASAQNANECNKLATGKRGIENGLDDTCERTRTYD